MKKFILTILTALTTLALSGCAEEENSTVINQGKVYTAELASNTVLDADNSYFLINIGNAVEIADTVVERVAGETDAEYNNRYEKAVQEAYARGVNIKVEGIGLNYETIVLNKDNGTQTDPTVSKTLIIVKKEEATEMKDAVYQIQVLLHAKTAVNAKSVVVSVGNQKFLFNNLNVKPARIWLDENGNEVTSVSIPQDKYDDLGNIIKKGINLISEPNTVNLYAYDSTNKMVLGPKVAASNISSLIISNMIEPFIIEDYAVNNADTGTSFPGCISNGEYRCGITISGYQTISTEKTLALSLTNQIDTTAVTSVTNLLVKGTKPVEYTISPLTTMYLNTADSAAIFDVKATTGNTIASTDITVTGSYDNGVSTFTLGDGTTALASGTYIIKEIAAGTHYRIFILASEAASAAANDAAGNLVITVKGENNTYKSNEVNVGKISNAYIAGNKLPANYKIGLNVPTKIDIKLNYFGPAPTLYKYNNTGTAADYFTSTAAFIPVLNSFTSGTGLTIADNTCTESTTTPAVDCSFTVTAASAITSSNAAANGNVSLAYNDGASTSPVTLPGTTINFYTTEDTTATTDISNY